MGKRKRDLMESEQGSNSIASYAKKMNVEHNRKRFLATEVTIQIIIGTYEKVLHGIRATIPRQPQGSADQPLNSEFADTFLMSAHRSAIRCLAISPPSSDPTISKKVILASGGSDQIINLYHISSAVPSRRKRRHSPLPGLAGTKISEDTRNRELGSLQHHNASINALYFPTRSKLLSASEDNTIAVARTRDWTVLSTIKAPIPKAHGRPSGDTAPLGGTPAGINDFAIHPSMKLMISVGKGEKCMRLWNLVTGKKAGVLNFDRNLLREIGEGRWGSGEGRKVAWNSLGEEFVVGFEKGCVVFGIDSRPKCLILPFPGTKIHQLHYFTTTGRDEAQDFLAVSTEDGRILFYFPKFINKSNASEDKSKDEAPLCEAIAQLGGTSEEQTRRIKDFEILKPPDTEKLLIVTGSSDGIIRLWIVDETDLIDAQLQSRNLAEVSKTSARDDRDRSNEMTSKAPMARHVGSLVGTYEAGNRITCLKAFIMAKAGDEEPTGKENDIQGKEDDVVDEG